MNKSATASRLFQRAALLWVIGFTLSAYGGVGRMAIMAASPVYLPPGPLKYVTHAIPALAGDHEAIVVMIGVALLLVACLHALLNGPRWWVATLIWLLYTNLMNNAWLAGSGGQHLMANVLFWSIFLAVPDERWQTLGFWIIRFQLLLAYVATGLHKLTGTYWIDGTAMGIAATDPAFGPAWLGSFPTLSHIATWAVLVFQLTFPVAVWFSALRLPWMAFGILFHLATALWMDIPEMGLAFIVCYSIWLSDHDFARLPWIARLTRSGRSMAG
ncbi:MAG: hypothetical protein IPM46_10670 [Flavobacteriales bacterium]|nr:hypothetical protein [Flavobacteriales bacterium]